MNQVNQLNQEEGEEARTADGKFMRRSNRRRMFHDKESVEVVEGKVGKEVKEVKAVVAGKEAIGGHQCPLAKFEKRKSKFNIIHREMLECHSLCLL